MAGLGVQSCGGLGFRVWGLGFRGGSGCRVWGLGFRLQTLELRKLKIASALGVYLARRRSEIDDHFAC